MNETAQMAKKAVLSGKFGTLATLDFETGGPFASLVNYACDEKGFPIFLLSQLARHTKCLLTDSRASLMVAEIPKSGDALTGLRATVMGHVSAFQSEKITRAYLSRHPYAESYVNFGDFGFYRLVPETIHVVGGFGRIQTFQATEMF